MFSTLLEKFLPYSSNLKLLSANSFRLEESGICHLGTGSWNIKKKVCIVISLGTVTFIDGNGTLNFVPLKSITQDMSTSS